MDYNLEKVESEEALSGIKEVWLAEFDSSRDSQFLDYLEHRTFTACERIVQRDDPASLWVLHTGAAKHPKALVELADATKAKTPSYKFLTLHIEPKLIIREEEDFSREKLTEVIDIIGHAIGASFLEAQNSHECKLKVWGGDELLSKELFPALILANDPDKTGLLLFKQAGWLIIDKK